MFDKWIEYEWHNSGSTEPVVDCHGIGIGFGSFITVSIKDLNTTLWGGEGLTKIIHPLLLEAKKHAPNKVPKEIVDQLRDKAILALLDYFSRNPGRFVEWVLSIQRDYYNDGIVRHKSEVSEIFQKLLDSGHEFVDVPKN